MVEIEEMFYDESDEIEPLKEARKKMKEKDFAKLINKRDLSRFEIDELFF